MVIFPLILGLVASSKQSISPGDTQSYNQTERWNYIILASSDTMKQRGNIRIILHYEDSLDTVLGLAIRKGSEPTFSATKSEILADYVDYNGWKNHRNIHYITIPYQYFNTDLAVYIGVGNSLSYVELVEYNITVEYSEGALCPGDCLAKGSCGPANECDCDHGYIDYDCSVLAPYMNPDEWYSFEVPLGQRRYGYFKMKEPLSLSISLKWDGPSSYLAFDWNGHDEIELPSEYESFKEVVLATGNSVATLRFNVDDIDGEYLYIGLMNIVSSADRELRISVKINAEYDYEPNMELLMYIFIGLSGFIVMLWVIGGIIRCKINTIEGRVRVAQAPQGTAGLSKEVIDKEFPVMAYRTIAKKDNESLCTICLEEFVMKDNVRKLACTHLFHAACIEEWFSTNKYCCLCKRDCSRTEDLDITVDAGRLQENITPVDLIQEDLDN